MGMNIEVKKYFDDLELWKSLPKIYGAVSIHSDRIVPTNNTKGVARLIKVDGVEYFRKKMYEESRVAEIASSEMYNELGIITPHLHLLTSQAYPEDNIANTSNNKVSSHSSIFTATINALNIPGYECVCANDVLGGLESKYGKPDFRDKWDVLYDEDMQSDFLQIMTKECFDMLINIFLLDELRTDSDRHTFNYILYRKKGSEKYEGVIPFDLENISLLVAEKRSLTDKNFNFFINKIFYTSYLPDGNMDNTTYSKRVLDMIDALHDGVLSSDNIVILKNALNYNFPEKLKELCQNPYFKKYEKRVVEPYSRIWEYNRNTLGKELGL